MAFRELSSEQVKAYHEDGYVIIREMFDSQEIEMLKTKAKNDPELKSPWERKDASGKTIRLKLWNHPPDNLYGAFARCERLVGSAERLLDGEVYHYHTKMIIKEPKVAGAWEWHQDYGYWYNNAVLYPLLTSCMIAVDASTRENGCLQVLKGSHHIGRIDHGQIGDQTGADPERVEQAKKRHELVHVELEPGDAVIFHSNLLHASAANESDKPRWTLICCYNAARNDPYQEIEHPCYTPLTKVPDSAIKETGRQEIAAE
ncbi:MAG: phytanoyl-CoA dioxygenase family protein [Candidatus Glassbacteria bacterium]|nr:phytanoyl-CoA dioxygenase family protein [Candidatus Glassbacteria bacterium]